VWALVAWEEGMGGLGDLAELPFMCVLPKNIFLALQQQSDLWEGLLGNTMQEGWGGG